MSLRKRNVDGHNKETVDIVDPPSKRIRSADADSHTHQSLTQQISPAAVTATAVRAIDWEEWHSATSTRNFLLKDPLLDWLALYGGTIPANHPEYAPKVMKVLSSSAYRGSSVFPNGMATSNSTITNSMAFVPMLMAQGNMFEERILALLYRKFSPAKIADISGGLHAARSLEKVQETIDAMNEGIPIIHGGIFHNHITKTYGITDLLVRSDFIEKLMNLSPLSNDERCIGAPLLRGAKNYHYIVIDIKFTTLLLRSDGIHILNTGSFPAYKSQLFIYNEALGQVQGYTPNVAYLLGRKWKYTSKGETYKGYDCFDRLGHVNFSKVDLDIVQKTSDALKWLDAVRTEGRDWDVVSRPLLRSELYPNMSNHYDYPWTDVKKELAQINSEITNVWYCGPAQRESALKHGVDRWNEERCTSKILGIKGEKISRTVDCILKCNRLPSDSPVKMMPTLLSPISVNPSNDLCEWRSNPSQLEFYVDFETVSDVFENMDKLPLSNYVTALIFMIGVGYIDRNPETGVNRWVYVDFTMNCISEAEEKILCTSFVDYVTKVCLSKGETSPRLTHWSHAEEYQWEKASEKAKLNWDTNILPRWFDLLTVFRDEPIVVKGCLNFGLKDVAKSMKSHGLISSDWPAGPYSDGSTAMLGAHHASKEAAAKGISMRDTPQMKEIIKYNEVDCKVLYEIITYLRAAYPVV